MIDFNPGVSHIVDAEWAKRLTRSDIRTFGAAGDGIKDDWPAFVGGDDSDEIRVTPGTYRIGSSLEIHAAMRMEPGAVIRPASGVTVTISGPFEAGAYRVFDLSAGGLVAFGKGAVERIMPQWWGARGDGVTDDTAAIEAARDAALALGMNTLHFPAGTYVASPSLDLGGLTVVGDGVSFAGPTVEPHVPGALTAPQVGAAERIGGLRIAEVGTIGATQDAIRATRAMLRNAGLIAMPSFTFNSQDVYEHGRWDNDNELAFVARSVNDFSNVTANVAPGDLIYQSGSTVKITGNGSVTYDLGEARDLSDIQIFELHTHFTDADRDNYTQIVIRFSDDASFTNYWNVNVLSSLTLVPDQGWRITRTARVLFGATGSPDWSNIRYIRIQTFAQAGTNPVLHLGELRFVTPGRGFVQMHFDDGLSSALQYALPVMHKYGLRGAAGIITSRPGAPGYMSWDEIRELADAGWDIVSHTHTHQRLADMTESQIRNDLSTAKALLQDHGYEAGAEVLLVPFGSWSDAVDKVARDYHPVCRTFSAPLSTGATGPHPANHPRGWYTRSPNDTHTVDKVIAWIDGAIETGRDVTISWHGFTAESEPTDTYVYPVSWFERVCAYVRKRIDEGDLVLLSPLDVFFR